VRLLINLVALTRTPRQKPAEEFVLRLPAKPTRAKLLSCYSKMMLQKNSQLCAHRDSAGPDLHVPLLVNINQNIYLISVSFLS